MSKKTAAHSNQPHHRPPRRVPGLAPGSIALPPGSPAPKIHVFSYDEHDLEEFAVESVEALPSLKGRNKVLWVNVNGLGDPEVIERLGEVFGLHPLALEDVTNLTQRPKVEVYGDHLYIVLRLQRWVAERREVASEQLSMCLGEGFVISFQEHAGDPFDPVRERIRRGRPVIRRGGADFLAYALMDAVVDHFFPLMESFGDMLDELEERVMEQPSQKTLMEVRRARRMLVSVRRSVWPMRDAMASIQSDTVPFFHDRTRPYLRDLFDHSLRILDLAESYRDQVGGLMDGYLSSVSFRMNEIMGLLTLVGTIFLPLGFLTGLYGMNFDPAASPYNMPELGTRYGYPVLLGVMFAIAGVLLYLFWRRGWFEVTGGGPRKAASPREEE